MNAKNFSDAVSRIDSKYIDEALCYKGKGVKHNWSKWGALAACFCLVFIGGFSLSHIIQNSSRPIPSRPAPSQGNMQPVQEPPFVPVSSLLAGNDSSSAEQAEVTAVVQIGPYKGVYVKTASADSGVLSESAGSAVSGTDTWYLVSGHTDLQYLIQNDGEAYSLWKFKCFDSDEYPYSDVLKLVYKIDSADIITKIKVNPATMDNTASGKAVQAEIGTRTITSKEEIDTMYQILSSLTCYGDNQWDMIDYGNAEAAADKNTSSGEAVRSGRYLTFVTSYGNEIDGLKYTAVSNMFYEYSGIAYNRLPEEQAGRIGEILRISKPEESQSLPESQNDGSMSLQSNDMVSDPTGETKKADITLNYVTELQTKVSNAMINKELPFVLSSAVYENPYRLHVVVSTDSGEDIAKLRAFDTVGNALEIEYSQTPVSLDEAGADASN